MARQGDRGAPSQRQLRVAEELRHVIADIFLRGEIHSIEIDGVSITVSEVRISPDLKNATVFITPLAGGSNAQKTVDHINKNLTTTLRRMISKKVVLRYTPKLHFKLDRSFDEAYRVSLLLNSPEVRRDVVVPTPQTDEDADHEAQ